MSSILQNRRFRQLEEGETVKSFNCGDAELNDFILNRAADYRKSLLSVSYVFEAENSLLAYFTLSNDSLRHESFNNKSVFNRLNRRINNAKRMREYPAMKIGRLAINIDYKNNGIGKAILNLIKKTLVENYPSGCRFITVDAYNSAIGFYQKNGFVLVNDFDPDRRTQPMFFDLAQLS